MDPKIEDVFKTSGVPTHTFVPPSSYNRLKVALRTPGRGVIVEGPSGIGKSTAVYKVLEELDDDADVVSLSARVPREAKIISQLPDGMSGTVIVDDFHRLDSHTKGVLADLLKVEADREGKDLKLVIVGINEAGRSLIESSPDLLHRVEIIRFERESAEKIDELVKRGEDALNVDIRARQSIIKNASGSFYIAQQLCFNACIDAEVLERGESRVAVNTSYEDVQKRVVEQQYDRFGGAVKEFARGTKFRPGGRAPYLHILKWMAESESWSLSVAEEMRKHPSEKVSVSVVLDRGYLASLCERSTISELMHFDEDTRILSVENPMLVYYLKSIRWPDFIRDVGFTKVDYKEEYDVALSFAGEDRPYVERLRTDLQDLGHSVFYDFDEQHRIIGQDVEEYLSSKYVSGCRYVVVVLGEMYGRKLWTRFESERYKGRFDKGEVILIRSTKIPPSFTDPVSGIGSLPYDPDGDLDDQARSAALTISKKLEER